MKEMVWYVRVVGRQHNEIIIISIFIGEVKYVTPIIFSVEQYHSWFQQLRDQFSPILVNTANDHVHFLNQVKGKVPICVTIYPKIVNEH